MGRDRPRMGLSPVLPRRGRSPRRPTPNDQFSLVTEEEANRLPHRAVRGHQLVGRTQSEVVQGSTANGSQDVFGATPFTTTHLPANQLQQRSHDDDFDPRAPPSPPPPPESKGNPPLEEIPQTFPPPPPGFADQEFEDFFIASEDPDVTMTTTEPQSKPHLPQPSEGFGDSFSNHPVPAFTSKVQGAQGDKGFPLCVVQTHLVPLVLCTELLPHYGPVPLPNLKMKVRTLLLPTQHRHIQGTKEQTLLDSLPL